MKGNLKDIQCFLFDLDGTIYLSEKLIPGALELLEELKKQGKTYAFVTNNSSRSKEEYVEKFRRIHLPAEKKEILVSTDATLAYLNKEGFSKICLLAVPSVEQEFIEAGFELVRGRGEEAEAVVLCFDTTLDYDKLWTACDYLTKGAAFIASHPDTLCPIEGGFKPDVGALLAFFKEATGREADIIGKPSPYLVEEALERFSLEKKDIAMVGDRLYTDIRTGIRSGITTIAVLSGESDAKMVAESEDQPDYVFPSVKELLDCIKK